jgi:hypothetical protein
MDCGSRVARAILRRSAPLPGNYQVGDLVSYRRRPRAGEQGTQWSSACRIIGKEGGKTIWASHESIPVCVPIDKIRPCTPAEALAYQYLSKGRTNSTDEVQQDLGSQQSFIDLRGEEPEEDDGNYEEHRRKIGEKNEEWRYFARRVDERSG